MKKGTINLIFTAVNLALAITILCMLCSCTHCSRSGQLAEKHNAARDSILAYKDSIAMLEHPADSIKCDRYTFSTRVYGTERTNDLYVECKVWDKEDSRYIVIWDRNISKNNIKEITMFTRDCKMRADSLIHMLCLLTYDE